MSCNLRAVFALIAGLAIVAEANSARAWLSTASDQANTGPGILAFSIRFATGSRTPARGWEAVLKRAAEAARANGDVRVVVSGHADRLGPAAGNIRLSEARAEAVRRALVAAGVPAARISVIGFGETYPRTVTADGVSDAANRRVEIVIGRTPEL